MNLTFLLVICAVFSSSFANDHFQLETSFEDHLMTASEIQIADTANVPKSKFYFEIDQDPRLFKTQTPHEKYSFGEQVGEEINKLANAMLEGKSSRGLNPTGCGQHFTLPVGYSLIFCTIFNAASEVLCEIETYGNCAGLTCCLKSATRQTDNPKAYETSVIEQLSLIEPTTVAKLPTVSAMNFI